jgi:hypothetical protein
MKLGTTKPCPRVTVWRTVKSAGKQMDARNGSDIRHYELVKMPDGTNV